MSAIPRKTETDLLLQGGGEMGERIREFDWSKTPLGSIDVWARSLRTAVQIMLASRYPMFIWWGTELTSLYNSLHIPVHGKKHPQALGRSARDVWAEAWATLGPQAEAVIRAGDSTWNDELRLFLERSGFLEETYFTFSYSPILGEDGHPAGLFGVCTEDTARVLGRRRLRTLRDLGERTQSQGQSVEEAVGAAAVALAENPDDLPFALVYLLDENGKSARLAATVPKPARTAAVLDVIELNDENDFWRFQYVWETSRPLVVEGLAAKFSQIGATGFPQGIQRAIVVPLARSGTQDAVAGFLIVGLSPRLTFDDDYQGFLQLVAGQIATSIANARAFQQERKRAEALAEIDRAKTAFFSNVSHEFRTPLTLMLGPLEEMLKTAGDLSPQNRSRIDLAHRNSLRLLKLVNSLLDFSRIEAGRAKASFEPTDLSALTMNLASNFRAAMEAAGLEFVVDCRPLPRPVYVDREMWEKIVLNLLSNAFKFTFEGRVCLSVEAKDDQTVLTVSDTGTGIPEAELPHLFKRFHRVEGAKGRTHEGTGIGLALVQELVKMHGGSIEVKSRPEAGSVFTVKVPFGSASLSAGPGQASTAVRAEAFTAEAMTWLLGDQAPAENGWRSRVLIADDNAAVREHVRVFNGGYDFTAVPNRTQGPVPERKEAERPRLLFADDNADMRAYVTRLLSPRFSVLAAPDGEAALDSARAYAPDVILSDVMMPKLDGFGLLRALRADPKLRGIPFILISARAGEESAIEGLEAGADDYLVKPFGARELVARIDTHLKLSRMREETRQALLDSARQRRLLEKVFAAQEEERRRIARELHDEAGQLLASLLTSMKLLDDSKRLAAAKVIARQMSEIVRLALDELRRLAHGLHPTVLTDHGLLPAVKAYVAEYSRRHHIRVRLKEHGLGWTQLPDTLQIALYRIIQEALTNIARHSHAGTVEITMKHSPDSLDLRIIDDGCGFDVTNLGPLDQDHLGLRSIHERSVLFGGAATFSSGNKGTQVLVQIPLLDGSPSRMPEAALEELDKV